MESLRELASHVAQQPQLLFGLHALGDGDEAEAAHERDDRAHELQRTVTGAEMADEAAVDLDAVDGQPVEKT